MCNNLQSIVLILIISFPSCSLSSFRLIYNHLWLIVIIHSGLRLNMRTMRSTTTTHYTDDILMIIQSYLIIIFSIDLASSMVRVISGPYCSISLAILSEDVPWTIAQIDPTYIQRFVFIFGGISYYTICQTYSKIVCLWHMLALHPYIPSRLMNIRIRVYTHTHISIPVCTCWNVPSSNLT